MSARGFSRVALLAWQLGIAVALIAVWHVATTTWLFGDPKTVRFFFSTPAEVAARVWKMFATGEVWKHLWITTQETALAFLIGVLVLMAFDYPVGSWTVATLVLIIPALVVGWFAVRGRVLEIARARAGFTGQFPVIANPPAPGERQP